MPAPGCEEVARGRGCSPAPKEQEHRDPLASKAGKHAMWNLLTHGESAHACWIRSLDDVYVVQRVHLARHMDDVIVIKCSHHLVEQVKNYLNLWWYKGS